MGDGAAESRYGIRSDYVANAPRVANAEEYWTERRIERSGLFQYHVYRRARSLVPTRGGRVLDLGCGTARKAAELLIPRCEAYCGVDRTSAIDYARGAVQSPKATFVVDDLERPSADVGGPFDVIVCADVIEHLAAPDRLMRFAADHLASDGRLVVSTPEREVMHGRGVLRSPNPEHVREWNRAELRGFLTQCGLVVRSVRLAPQFRIDLSETGLKLLRSQLLRPVRYWGCQVAICAKA